MSKTNFTSGSFLTPTFQNTIYGVGPNDGHQHDGQDSDGHAKKIVLATDTDGVLPLAQVPIIPLDSSGVTGCITASNITGMITSFDWCVGVTGVAGLTGAQEILGSKVFEEIYVTTSTPQGDSMGRIWSTHTHASLPSGWQANTVIVQPHPTLTYRTASTAMYLPAPALSCDIRVLGWPLTSSSCMFYLNLLVTVVGQAIPWKLEGQFSYAILAGISAYAVPHNYTLGYYPNWHPGWTPNVSEVGTVQLSLSNSGGNVILTNNTGAIVRIAGTVATTS